MGKLSMDLYLDNVKKKYKNARRKEKSEIIAEACVISDLSGIRASIGRPLCTTQQHKEFVNIML